MPSRFIVLAGTAWTGMLGPATMAFDLLILNGTVVSSNGIEQADVGISGHQIAEIGDLKQRSSEETIDANGLHVFPGAIDTQVHFREPGLEHKEDLESGTRAAVAGGVTTIFEMPNTQPPTTTLEALWDKLHRAHGRAWCNYAFFVGASSANSDLLAELEMAPGAAGIKIFMGSSTGPLLVEGDDALRPVLANGRRPCPVHAEEEPFLRQRKLEWESGGTDWGAGVEAHHQIRDAEAARFATERILRLSEETGRPVHILHVSTADEIPHIRVAKQRGLRISAEVTPQHLWFAAPECYERLGTFAQMNPPIRDEFHRDALRAALKEGVFDVFGSDHAPHTIEEKAKPYPASPSGMPGVQTLMPVLLTLSVRDGLLDLPTLVQMSAEAPAERFGIVGKGRIAEGFDADIALFDLGRPFVVDKPWLQSRCGWSAFEAEELVGWPTATVVGGRVAMRDGEIIGPPSGTMVQFNWKPGFGVV